MIIVSAGAQPTLIDRRNEVDGASTMDEGVEPAITGEPPEEQA
jgi:hypothetical protein